MDRYRKQAEGRVRGNRHIPEHPTREEFQRVVHELEVHQIELEMQNDELRASQAVLEESRYEYADLYDFSPIGYFSFDAAGLILRANLTGTVQLGVERHLLIKTPFTLYLSRADQARFRDHLQSVFETQTRQACALRIEQRTSGRVGRRRALPSEGRMEPLDVQMESLFVKGPAFGPSCRTAITNITLRQRAEDALPEREDRYRLLVESVRDYAIVMLDLGGHVSTWNAGAEQIHGYRADEIIGRHVSCLCTADDETTGNPQQLLAIAEREPSVARRGWFQRQDGSRFRGDLLLTALRDGAGRISAFSMINRDLTERRRADEETKKVGPLESIEILAGDTPTTSTPS
ncbi:MAG: PAS domain S-box protein [Nitrospiria bacterium]